MAGVTGKGLRVNFAQEVPSGTVNGANTSFSLAQTPYAQNAVFLFVDVVPLIAGTDFSISGTTITMVEAPASGQSLTAWYMRKS